MLRETVTAYTVPIILENECTNTLGDALIRFMIELCPLDGPPALVRTDPAPGFQSLAADDMLRRHNIQLELGRARNKNKNPIADKGIQEFEEELLKQEPGGGPVSTVQLALVVARLNSWLRGQGMSARELWTQRGQFTHQQLSMKDDQVIKFRHAARLCNHPYKLRLRLRLRQSLFNKNIYKYHIRFT